MWTGTGEAQEKKNIRITAAIPGAITLSLIAVILLLAGTFWAVPPALGQPGAPDPSDAAAEPSAAPVEQGADEAPAAAANQEADASNEPGGAETRRAATGPDEPSQPQPANADAGKADKAGLVRLAPDQDVWIDPKKKIVVVDGFVCLRQGQLEMFACPEGTKEHESIVAVKAKPSFVHAGLLAIGAEAGTPVQFEPQYEPATGTPIEVLILWKDSRGKARQVRAQQWVRNVQTQQPMQEPWVFAGSGFWVEEGTGKRYYHADGGDFICVSNFPTATLDIPVASSQANASLMFEAATDKIPPLKTQVRLVLYPKVPKKQAGQAQEPAGQAQETPEAKD